MWLLKGDECDLLISIVINLLPNLAFPTNACGYTYHMF